MYDSSREHHLTPMPLSPVPACLDIFITLTNPENTIQCLHPPLWSYQSPTDSVSNFSLAASSYAFHPFDILKHGTPDISLISVGMVSQGGEDNCRWRYHISGIGKTAVRATASATQH
eukprot:73364_1